MSNSHPSKRFAVAVSFPGEHRKFVKNVVERLAEVLGRERVFYDEWYQAELLGLDGDLKLRRYYREQSELVVPFFSEHYRKDWCQIEWSAIRSMLKHRRSEDAVVPVEMDGTRIEGWEPTDFAIRKKQRTGKQIADLILDAYRHRYPETESSSAPDPAPLPGVPGRGSFKSEHGAHVAPNVTRKIAGSQLDKHAAKKLFGRETELAALDAAWAAGTLNVYTLVAWGGAGKTSLVFHWVQTRFAAHGWPKESSASGKGIVDLLMPHDY